jgi:hypothetical protein
MLIFVFFQKGSFFLVGTRDSPVLHVFIPADGRIGEFSVFANNQGNTHARDPKGQ